MKKALKKLATIACIIAMLASSIPVFAAGYEVVMEPSINYIDGKLSKSYEEGSWEYKQYGPVWECETYFYPMPFRNGVSIVHNNVYVMPGFEYPTFYAKSSYVVDAYGNKVELGDYDAYGTYPFSFSDNLLVDLGSESYDECFKDYTLPAFDNFEGVDSLGYIIVCKNGKGGLIDTKGNVIIPCEYDDLYDVYKAFGIEYDYSDADEYSGKYYAYNWFDPYYYDMVFTARYYNGLAVVSESEEEGSKFGIVDTNDNIVVPFIYDAITPCYDGTCWVLKDGKWGIIRVSNSKVSVTVNNTPLTFDQNPLVINGRTLAPVRAIFEALGATVEWKNDTREVISTKGDVTITMAIDSTTMYKNGTPITLDVAPQIVGGRTLVPVRAIAEAFNCTVEWNNDTQTVIITAQ